MRYSTRLVIGICVISMTSCTANEKKRPPMGDLVESSTNFDASDIRPFCKRVSPLITAGFGDAEITAVADLAQSMAHEEEKELVFNIRLGNQECVMRIVLFKDDIDSFQVFFFSPPELAEKITAEIVRYCDELGR